MKLSELTPGQCFEYDGTTYVVLTGKYVDSTNHPPPKHIPTLVLSVGDADYMKRYCKNWDITFFIDEEMGADYTLLEDV